MKIDDGIRTAIRKAIDLHGNMTQFAKKMGIAHSTVLFWLSGKTAEVSGRLWAQRLRPELLPFLEGSAFAGRPLPKEFFTQASGSAAAPGVACGEWKRASEVPVGALVRFKSPDSLIGVISLASEGGGSGGAKLSVQMEFRNMGVVTASPKLAMLAFEVYDGGAWLPAGGCKTQ